MNTVRAFAKPHVAIFLSRKYGNPIRLQHNRMFAIHVKSALTSHFVDRVDRIPQDMRLVEFSVTGSLAKLYMHESHAHNLAEIFEYNFWMQAVLDVSKAVNITGSIQNGIDAFYLNYGLSDDLYDRDNFRKQLQRRGLKNPKQLYLEPGEKPEIQRANKLTPNIQMRIARLHKNDGHSLRTLGRCYGVSYNTIRNYVQKFA